MTANTIYTLIGLMGIAMAILFFFLPPDKPRRPGSRK
jgi:uncharacterized membrane protein YuzA (DUF378 family)